MVSCNLSTDIPERLYKQQHQASDIFGGSSKAPKGCLLPGIALPQGKALAIR